MHKQNSAVKSELVNHRAIYLYISRNGNVAFKMNHTRTYLTVCDVAIYKRECLPDTNIHEFLVEKV